METATRFDRMTFRYKYTTDSGEVLWYRVKGGEVVKYEYPYTMAIDYIQAGEEYALEQWQKARAAYLEEAQEQELADRIARSRNED